MRCFAKWERDCSSGLQHHADQEEEEESNRGSNFIPVITVLPYFPDGEMDSAVAINEHLYQGSYINLVSFHRINSTLLMKLPQSHILMDAHYHNFAHFSPSPSLVMPVDFNCAGLSDETEHRQGAGISFFISNNIEPLGCSFHLV